MIEVRELTFAYPHSAPVFQGFNWRAARGETWTVLGPSGCGKSTLLYLLAGLRLPNEGEILIDGETVTRPRPQTGLILQEYGLLPWATVRENASLGLRIRGFYGPDGKHVPENYQPPENIDRWLKRLGIAAIESKYPNQISGGQRQRTAIARTLAIQPDLLLMDEPFSSLDAPTRESLQNLTLELQGESGLTLVVVTHSIEEAAVLGRKILLLNNPPNLVPDVIENHEAADRDYRNSSRYSELVRALRQRMDTGRGELAA